MSVGLNSKMGRENSVMRGPFKRIKKLFDEIIGDNVS